MKNTYFLSMLAAALLGGQVFAAPTGTAVEGYDTEHSTTDKYYGTYSDTGSATGGNVTIKADDEGEVPNNAYVYGGCSTVADASGNTLTMQGGTIGYIYGGFSNTGGASNNTVVMNGGTVKTIRGGNGASGLLSNNVVIVTGGTVSSMLYGAFGTTGSTVSNNSVHLVGKGASNVSIKDGQGNPASYNGGDSMTLTMVAAGLSSGSTHTGNSINIYGTGITLSAMTGMQILTFNITNAQVAATTPEVAVNHTPTAASMALNLIGVDLQIKDLDVQAWTPGKTITLVQSTQAIQVGDDWGEGKAVDITNATGVKVAQGKLQLVDALEGPHLLTLTIQGNVPEPTTVTLTMLALAGLCARRRKK